MQFQIASQITSTAAVVRSSKGVAARFFGVLLLAAAANHALASTANEFESITVGLKVEKPAEWQFITADEYLDNIRRAQLTDQEFQQRMQKYATAPLVAMLKYPEPYDDLNPSFKVNVRPLGQFKGADPRQIMDLFLAQLKKSFSDFEVVKGPAMEQVSGLDAAYMQVNYSLAIPDGRKFPTTSELWVVPRGDYFFMIGAGTRQDEKTGSRAEIRKILHSLIINH